MNDRNGTPLAVGARVRFRAESRDEEWHVGTVRRIYMLTYYARGRRMDVWEIVVDDGDPANADLHTNGCTVAACIGAGNIELLEAMS